MNFVGSNSLRGPAVCYRLFFSDWGHDVVDLTSACKSISYGLMSSTRFLQAIRVTVR